MYKCNDFCCFSDKWCEDVTTPTGGTEHFVLKARNGKTKTIKLESIFMFFVFGVTGGEEKEKKSHLVYSLGVAGVQSTALNTQ